MKALLVTMICSLIALCVFGQENTPQKPTASQAHTAAAAATVPKYEYEVASIKPDKSGDLRTTMSVTTGSFSATNVSPAQLIRSAYGLSENQLDTVPDWLKSDRYNIQAKADPSAAAELEKLSPNERKVEQDRMLQVLLEDRFHLRVHRDTKQLPVYWLVVSKPGKLHEAQDDCDPTRPPRQREPGEAPAPVCGSFTGYLGHVTGHKVTVAQMCQMMSNQAGRPILDKTALAGRYDATLDWTPDEGQTPGPPVGARPNAPPPPDPNGPSLFTALQEQLGLKLESGKGPVQIFVIDHIERPSEN